MTDNWPLHVLIVEDDYFLAGDLVKMLTDWGLKVLDPVSDAVSARVHIDSGRVGAAIVDLNLGEGPSMEIAALLVGRGIPLIFVTGYDRSSLTEAYANVPLLPKPVNEARLRAFLSGIVKGAEPRSSTQPNALPRRDQAS